MRSLVTGQTPGLTRGPTPGLTPGHTVGRPRDPDVVPRVRAATLRLLVSNGYAALRIDDIALTAGVAKTTIYRRWPSLGALILDAVDAALGPRKVAETGDVRADLLTLLALTHRSLVANPIGWDLPAIGLSVMQDPVLGPDYRRRFVDPLREQAVRLVRQGMEQGEFAGVDPEVLFDVLAGAFIYRRLIGEPPPPLESLTALAETLLRG